MTSGLHFPYRRIILYSATVLVPKDCELRFLFEDYALDTDLRELQRGAVVVSVTPQVFDLLDYLIHNRGASSARTT